MIDHDLANLYGVETKQLKRQVRRNIERFPEGFMFELTKEEFENLRCHIGTSRWGGARYLPLAFTEHGAVMLASVLNSRRAIKVNIQIVRAFVILRKSLHQYDELREKIESMEKKYDQQFQEVFIALRHIMTPPMQVRGFRPAIPPTKSGDEESLI